MSSDELKKIFNEDCSYDEKVKKVKIAMQEKLEDANSYLTSSFSFGMTDFLWIRCIYKFMPFIPLIFGIGVLSLASFTRFFSKRKAAKDMLDHLENSNDDLNSENNNNNNNNRKKMVKELEKKKKYEKQKSNKVLTQFIILSIISFVLVGMVSSISSLLLPVGIVTSLVQVPSFIKLLLSINKEELIQGEIDKLNFDILSYEDRLSKEKNHTINSDNLNNKKTKKDKDYSKQFDNSVLDAYLNYISNSGNGLEDEKPKTYSKKW